MWVDWPYDLSSLLIGVIHSPRPSPNPHLQMTGPNALPVLLGGAIPPSLVQQTCRGTSEMSILECKPSTILLPQLGLIPVHHSRCFYCTGCNIVMKQKSNMTTHINTQCVSAVILRAAIHGLSVSDITAQSVRVEGDSRIPAPARGIEMATGHPPSSTHGKPRTSAPDSHKVRENSTLGTGRKSPGRRLPRTGAPILVR
jgi:hypothetical protein